MSTSNDKWKLMYSICHAVFISKANSYWIYANCEKLSKQRPWGRGQGSKGNKSVEEGWSGIELVREILRRWEGVWFRVGATADGRGSREGVQAIALPSVVLQTRCSTVARGIERARGGKKALQSLSSKRKALLIFSGASEQTRETSYSILCQNKSIPYLPTTALVYSCLPWLQGFLSHSWLFIRTKKEITRTHLQQKRPDTQ